ncbi:putative quinate permease [Cyphellophora attinorum]|uniref:Putative quinate permease n=1 Tax=Cyphellophora attinorum TaxID=1664694 RepID=A0A0N1P0Y7_9EURO|nr:putative quinate permease [Phialophora attinorum]KPI41267.1 putative quinate permease [Phialophora attinorum]
MVSGGADFGQAALSQKRAQFAGPSGIKGLIGSSHVFAIAVFASLGGFVYGYNQGMFGQILSMTSFSNTVHPESISNTTLRGFLTAILELGAWVGVLVNGIMADASGAGLRLLLALSFSSMLVPLYNAELSPPELRGSLVSLQQLAICFGIMISYWIGYGTNFIGGTGEGQSNAAWLVPVCIQLLPALVLGVGIMFLPESPRWLAKKGRDEESLQVIANLRRKSPQDEGVQLEYLEIKAQHMFERETSIAKFPHLQGGGLMNNIKLGFNEYAALLKNKSLFKRVTIAVFIMVFQQWSGINAILYYASFIFKDLGLTGSTTSLLAGGVGGVLLFLATIPAVLYIDQWGRKPLLITGAIGMGVSHIIVAGLQGKYQSSWDTHKAAGWVAVVFVWIYEVNFGYSWGPGAWVLISEIFPLGARAKGISIGGSSNWLNNFAIGQATPDMVAAMTYGTFIFFGAICFLAAAFVYFVVPETKNLTLEEMDEIFGDTAGTAVEDRDRLNKIYVELGLFSAHEVETRASVSAGVKRPSFLEHHEQGPDAEKASP